MSRAGWIWLHRRKAKKLRVSTSSLAYLPVKASCKGILNGWSNDLGCRHNALLSDLFPVGEKERKRWPPWSLTQKLYHYYNRIPMLQKRNAVKNSSRVCQHEPQIVYDHLVLNKNLCQIFSTSRACLFKRQRQLIPWGYVHELRLAHNAMNSEYISSRRLQWRLSHFRNWKVHTHCDGQEMEFLRGWEQ